MDKKELKFYEAPACEVVELKMQGVLCGSIEETNAENAEVENPGEE